MQDELVAHTLNLILDDRLIGEYAISEVHKRLGRANPQDREFWQAYTVAINELIDAAQRRNQKSPSG